MFILSILGYLLLTAVATGVVWKGSEWLESSSERLSAYYDLPPLVQGTVILAIGSSFPELSTVVLSTALHGDFELGVSAIVGSALFNILMIPALSGIWSGNQLPSTRDLIYKETQFYLISVLVLLLVFCFAIIYNPVGDDGGVIRGSITRGIAFFPLALYAFYVFLQYQDTVDHESGDPPVGISLPHEYGTLLGGLVIILIGVEGLVQAAIGLGDVLGTPSFLWGITVVAAGTSVPDAFVSIRAARSGNTVASVANVIGSNVFDLLVCIPAGVLIAGAVVIDFSVGAPMIGLLIMATLIIFIMMRVRMSLSIRESWSLIAIYCAFVLWMGSETFGIVDFLPHVPPGG